MQRGEFKKRGWPNLDDQERKNSRETRCESKTVQLESMNENKRLVRKNKNSLSVRCKDTTPPASQLREKETKDNRSNSVLLNQENRKENIKILYTNCNGLSNKMDELTTRLNYLDADVALICETKFGIETGNEGLPSNYEIIRKDREGGRGGGVCIMIKKDLRVVECSKLNRVDAGQNEHIWCKIKSAIGENMVTVGVIYR